MIRIAYLLKCQTHSWKPRAELMIWMSSSMEQENKVISPLFSDVYGCVQSSCILFSSLAHKCISKNKGVKQSQTRTKALGSTRRRHKLPTHFTPTHGIHVDSGTTKTPFTAHRRQQCGCVFAGVPIQCVKLLSSSCSTSCLVPLDLKYWSVLRQGSAVWLPQQPHV